MTKRLLPKTQTELNAAANNPQINYFITPPEIADYYFAKITNNDVAGFFQPYAGQKFLTFIGTFQRRNFGLDGAGDGHQRRPLLTHPALQPRHQAIQRMTCGGGRCGSISG